MRQGARSSYEARVEWWTASVVVVTAPDKTDEQEVRTVMDCAARAEGRTVASTYRMGSKLVGWCPLAAGSDPRWVRAAA